MRSSVSSGVGGMATVYLARSASRPQGPAPGAGHALRPSAFGRSRSPPVSWDPNTPRLLLRGIDRMAAARLVAEGDSVQEIRLLRWPSNLCPLDDKPPLKPLAYLLEA
jgi:hypothetical protein